MISVFRKLIVPLCLLLALILPFNAHAQDDPSRAPLLTWDDAPLPPLLRHQGDAQIRWGNENTASALGPFTDENFSLGQISRFWLQSEKYVLELGYISEHAYYWFDDRSGIDEESLAEAALYFDRKIWEMNRYVYGENATPGIDGDSRIYIVHLADIYWGLLGFFNPNDQCAEHICTGSNQRDIIYIVTDNAPLNSASYHATIAHEFQHLIQFHVDGNEYRWMDEGFSQFAELLNGYPDDEVNLDNIESYLENTNHPLNSWTFDYDTSPFYGSGYLFITYLYERFGLEFIQALARSPYDGLAAVHHTLQALQPEIALDDLVLDWFIANHVNNVSLEGGEYGYNELELPEGPAVQPIENLSFSNTALQPYGVDYLTFNKGGTFLAEFTGDFQTPLVPTIPYSGDWMWWSYNATASASTLTREVDLRNVEKATLEYALWWQATDGESYLHVLVSPDGGQTWIPQQGDRTTGYGAYEAPGAHYYDISDGWLTDKVDLSGYTGTKILLRFEYVTNNFAADHGFVLDNITIPEIGFSDDVETLDSGWRADGFLRTQEHVNQHWRLAFVSDEALPQIQIIPVEAGMASISVTIPPTGGVFIVGGMAPFTHNPAAYTLQLSPHP